MRAFDEVPPCPDSGIRDRIPLLRCGAFQVGRVEYITTAFPRTGALAPPRFRKNMNQQMKLQFTAGDEGADARQTYY
jgi:hypothetical protein